MIIYREEPRRFGVRATSGRNTLEDGQWFADQDDGGAMPIDHPLRQTRPVAAPTSDDMNGAEPAWTSRRKEVNSAMDTEHDTNEKARAPPV